MSNVPTDAVGHFLRRVARPRKAPPSAAGHGRSAGWPGMWPWPRVLRSMHISRPAPTRIRKLSAHAGKGLLTTLVFRTRTQETRWPRRRMFLPGPAHRCPALPRPGLTCLPSHSVPAQSTLVSRAQQVKMSDVRGPSSLRRRCPRCPEHFPHPRAGEMTSADQQLQQAFADLAAIGLVQQRALRQRTGSPSSFRQRCTVGC
jgi:hypothetical protein